MVKWRFKCCHFCRLFFPLCGGGKVFLERVLGLLRIGLSIGLCTVLWSTTLWSTGLWSVPAAIASIHTYPEGAERVMFRSLQTIRDRDDQAWQLVLFKRVNRGRTESIHLRVVGFPGQATLTHPGNLAIMSSDRTWIAADTLLEPSPFPANVGEYNIQDFVTHLTLNSPLKLVLPSQDDPVELTIPPFVVKEWRAINRMKAEKPEISDNYSDNYSDDQSA
jgi:Protein of unknown function (DUF3122)